MKLLAIIKSKMTKAKNGENMLCLEITEVVLIHCYIVSNDYHQYLRVLYAFVPNKLFGQLLDISPKKLIFSKCFNLEFSYQVWLTDQNSNPFEVEPKHNFNY